MPRYFIELAYKGTRYSGFQIQENANTIQAEVEKAFQTLHRTAVVMTGSSRTDAGVHALQNFFHFDFEKETIPYFVYKMNAILPQDIAIKNIFRLSSEAHSRFDAISREYRYQVHRFKDPFLQSTSFFFPYKLNIERMQTAAELVKEQTNFFAFAKTNSQVKHFNCKVTASRWITRKNCLVYQIEANRFLRGMVRSLTATLLKVGREKMLLEDFTRLFTKDIKCGFSVPAHGLLLQKVNYPVEYFSVDEKHFTGF